MQITDAVMDIIRLFRNFPIAVTPAVAIAFPGIAACAIC